MCVPTLDRFLFCLVQKYIELFVRFLSCLYNNTCSEKLAFYLSTGFLCDEIFGPSVRTSSVIAFEKQSVRRMQKQAQTRKQRNLINTLSTIIHAQAHIHGKRAVSCSLSFGCWFCLNYLNISDSHQLCETPFSNISNINDLLRIRIAFIKRLLCDQNNWLPSILFLIFCLCLFFTSLLQGERIGRRRKIRIHTWEHNNSIHLKQLVPIPKKTEIFISIEFYFHSAELIRIYNK